MATGRNLSKLASGLDSEGVLSAEKGGTGNTTGISSTTPSISSLVYPGDDTATDTAGGQTITVNGSNFNPGIKVIVNDIVASVVTRISATQITFTAPANPAGTYLVSLVNTDGTTGLVVPGLSYSGVPTWTTAAGSIGSTNPNTVVSYTIAATGDAPITYSVASGALPSGLNLNSTTGVISGTTPVIASSTTYNFTLRATDAQNQDTDRAFSLTSVPNTYDTTTLLVGGGGGGAMGGGGGGGGGVIEVTYTAYQYNTYNIVVGAGGQGSTNLYDTAGIQGGSSSAFGFTAYGGGGGGLGSGGSGASGGGSSGAFAVQGSPGSGITGQGYAGGQGYGHNGNWNNRASAGGGGGAGGAGGSGTQVGVAPQVAPGGNGGSGKSSSLSGSSVTYAGGGPGNGDPYQTQLGNAGSGQGNAGGGGSGLYTGGSYADSGKNGLVIITYPDTRPLASSTTGNPTITTSGGSRRYSWSSVGNWSITF